MLKLIIKIILINIFFFTNAFSYVGPGLGGGIIAATLGIVIAIIAALFAIIWFPIKRFLKKKKRKKLTEFILITVISILIYETLIFFSFKKIIIENLNTYKSFFKL
ncbi:hypothetical protein OAY95_04965, partial [Candidatus Pelagibacter sp.]|nr:hypothetical protein [Candidatus Pelagibacter sp.]